jgi:hypothetical protein
MVKSIRTTVHAEFLSQLRTLKVSDKARRQVEALIALENRLVNEAHHVHASNNTNIRVVEHSSNDVASFEDKLRQLHNKKVRFDANFFGDLLNHVASMPSDGSFVPSRRHVLRNILHAKMEDGVYLSNKSSANKLSWEDFDHLVLSLLTLRSLVSSSRTTIESADSSFDDLKTSMDRLARKVDTFNALSRGVDESPLESRWSIKIEGGFESDTEFASGSTGLRGVSSQMAFKQARAFSTAPIWYQQGMENGPPLSKSRWRGEAAESVKNPPFESKMLEIAPLLQ